LLKRLGFSQTYWGDKKDVAVFSQGQINFTLNTNTDPESRSRQYFQKHGEGVSKISFLVENVEHAITEAVKRGAKDIQNLEIKEDQNGVYKTAAIQGFGDVINEFVERPSGAFRNQYYKLPEDPDARPLKTRCSRIDHFTNNVPKGQMEHWVDFYQKIYGFVQTRYFDIKGVKTGLQSKVVQLADNSIIIPINEPEAENGKSQIQEFLDRHNGAGVQHIALMTPDIVSTISDLQKREIKFLDIPSTYYEDIPAREQKDGYKVQEDFKTLEPLQILVDGDKDGYLLQIFSDTYIGPLFFEYIQRKGHWGFGEGNFQALFDAIERDQMKRGYLE
jgi:4-hydroxyphenylpyruvate dioxygenase